MREEFHVNDGVQSTMHILGHPIHPMLVMFPTAFLVGALVTDLVFLAVGETIWANLTLWLLVGGLGTGVVAALVGLVDFLTIRRARETSWGWIHFVGNGLALVLAAVNIALRVPNVALTDGLLTAGVALSAIIVFTLVITGWAGGELVYRHRIGVLPARAQRHERGEERGEERPAA